MKRHRFDVAFLGGRGFQSSYGGVENAVRNISKEMKNHNVSVAVYGNGELPKKSNSDGVFEVEMPRWVYSNFGQHIYIFFCVLHLILILRPKVVYVFASGPSIFIPLIRVFRIKVISSLRAIDSARDKWGWLNRSILKLGEYCAWKYSTRFTVNSLAMVEHFKSKRTAHYVPNGINKISDDFESTLEKFSLKPDAYILFAARLDPVKRLHILLSAYSKIVNRNYPLIIAGGNCKDKEYERELKKHECKDIRFIGHINSIEADILISKCKIFVLPSVLEGMSNSLLSAMSSGRPCLVSSVPENASVVFYNDAQFKADDEDDLIEKLDRLIHDDNFSSNLGNDLKARALTEFSWQNTTRLFYELYLNVNLKSAW